jgi:hypothetical protein
MSRAVELYQSVDLEDVLPEEEGDEEEDEEEQDSDGDDQDQEFDEDDEVAIEGLACIRNKQVWMGIFIKLGVVVSSSTRDELDIICFNKLINIYNICVKLL